MKRMQKLSQAKKRNALDDLQVTRRGRRADAHVIVNAYKVKISECHQEAKAGSDTEKRKLRSVGK